MHSREAKNTIIANFNKKKFRWQIQTAAIDLSFFGSQILTQTLVPLQGFILAKIDVLTYQVQHM